MVDFGAFAAGIGGGVLNMLGGQSQQSAIDDQINAALRSYRKLKGRARVAGGLALQERQRALADAVGGYDQALAETSRSGRSAEISAMDEAQAATGAAGQSLISAGMYDPQAITWARRGISSDLMRAIGGIRSMTAQQRAGLMTGRGAASAGARGDIASQYMQNYGLESIITDRMVGLGTMYQPASQDYGGDFGSAIAALFAKRGGSTGYASFGDTDYREATANAFKGSSFDPWGTDVPWGRSF